MRKMILLECCLVFAVLWCGMVRCLEEPRESPDLSRFVESELEREFPVNRRDSLYAQLTDAYEGGRNGSLGRLETAGSSHGASKRLSMAEDDDLEEQEAPQRRLREAARPGKPKKSQQRYLPYSPSYAKSLSQFQSFSPVDYSFHTGGEILLSRQARDTRPRVAKRKQRRPSRPAVQPDNSLPASSPPLFAYDIDLAESSGVTAVQPGPEGPAPGPDNSPPVDWNDTPPPDVMAFDMAPPNQRPPPAGPPPQINPAQFQRAWGPAMRGAQQDFMQKVANQPPNQCVVGSGGGPNPSLTWVAGNPSQNTRFAYQSEFAGRRLADQFTNGDAGHLFAYLDQNPDAQPSDDDSDCYNDNEVDCDPDSPYRTQDGTCNNLANPLYGSANWPQNRLAPAEYEDGISEPRRLSLASKVQNRPILLPSAREVSVAISQNLDIESKRITYMFNQFGQFIAHDLTNTPVEKVADPQNPKNSISPTCCGTQDSCTPHPACYPIMIAPNDPVFGQYGINCMEFTRSQPAPQPNCRLGTRIQMNSVTSFLDGSQIYGSKTSDTNRLRLHRGGQMRINDSPIVTEQGLIMVPGGINTQGCVSPSADMPCVDGGDLRVNQHTGLVTIHSLFLRLHNAMATFIATARPDLPDEIVFQQVRKMVGATLQHIYFKEIVPVIVGRKIASNPDNGLALTKKGYCDCYDDSIDATMQVEFAAGAYRFHTLQDNTLPVTDDNGVEYPFYMHFGNPKMWYKPGIIDELLRNLPSKPAEAYDAQFAFIFQNQVFKPTNKPTGIDMLAFNNQRGRDHGIRSYVDMRKICGLSPVKTFRDLQRVMPKSAAENLAKIYRHIRDIDFYAGAVSERAVNRDGLVGPTFACVLTNQFQKIKNGDRFWYENEGVLTPDQLKFIRKKSISAILCRYSETQQVQPHAFLIISESNPVTPCEDILAGVTDGEEVVLQGLPRPRHHRPE